MLDPVERGGEVFAEVVLRVVGEDRVDGDGVRGEELFGAFPEPGASRTFLIRKDLAICETAMRIDGGVHEVVANSVLGLMLRVFAAAHTPTAPGRNPAQFLDINVHEFARPVGVNTPNDLTGRVIHPREPVEPVPAQHSMHG
jgi:hypothetical protein